MGNEEVIENGNDSSIKIRIVFFEEDRCSDEVFMMFKDDVNRECQF